MATETWHSIYVLENFSRDLQGVFETSAIAEQGFAVLSIAGSPDFVRIRSSIGWTEVTASTNTESWSDISAA
jgi:hypothetical protein|tara:strand:- start:2521 stop:2736 length:216 start_codon:yes stop_codon:yes gene_type:complete